MRLRRVEISDLCRPLGDYSRRMQRWAATQRHEYYKNSSGDETANVNLFYYDTLHAGLYFEVRVMHFKI